MLEEKTSVITVLFILMITLCIVDFDCLDIADNLPTPDNRYRSHALTLSTRQTHRQVRKNRKVKSVKFRQFRRVQ